MTISEPEWTRADHDARTDRLRPLADHLRVGHDVLPELRRYQDTWLHIALLAEEWFEKLLFKPTNGTVEDDLRSRLACVLEASYADRPYDERLAAIRGMCDLTTDGMTPTGSD